MSSPVLAISIKLFFTSGCAIAGQFLRDPSSPCQYLVCVWPEDPWPGSDGRIPLVTQTLQCAPGTGVAPSFGSSMDNPCSAVTDACKVAPGRNIICLNVMVVGKS